MSSLPSYDQCMWFINRLGEDFKGGWQQRSMSEITQHPRVIYRGPRQNSGKTWVSSRYTGASIYKGNAFAIGMPTQRQGQHILSSQIGNSLRPFENKSFRRIADNVTFKNWNNGGWFGIVSTDESAKSGVQGYTTVGLLIDEAHEASPLTFEMLEPAIDVAQLEDRAKILLLGIGGDGDEHLIAEKIKAGYHLIHVTPDEIINTAKPEWRERYREFFAMKKATLSPRSWAKNYLCEDWAEGKRRIFPEPREGATGNPNDTRYIYYHGIDVGKVIDATAISTWRCNVIGQGFQQRTVRAEWVHTEILDGLNYVKQAEEIIAYILDRRWGEPRMRPRYNFAIETNGPGDVLRDIIIEKGFEDCLASWTNQKFKQDAVDTFNAGFRHGWLGVPHESTLSHIAKLNFELKAQPGGGTKTDWDHSDILSAGLVGVMLLPPVGVTWRRAA